MPEGVVPSRPVRSARPGHGGLIHGALGEPCVVAVDDDEVVTEAVDLVLAQDRQAFVARAVRGMSVTMVCVPSPSSTSTARAAAGSGGSTRIFRGCQIMWRSKG